MASNNGMSHKRVFTDQTKSMTNGRLDKKKGQKLLTY